MVCRPIASLASNSLLAMQNLRPHSRPTPAKYTFQENYTVGPLHVKLQVANFQRREHASGSSKELEAVPSVSGMSDIVACPLYLIADDPSELPSPVSSSWLFTRCQPVCQLLYYTPVLFKVLYCKIKKVLFFCICFLYIICAKSIINLLRPSIIQPIVLVPRLTSLDLWTNCPFKLIFGMELVYMKRSSVQFSRSVVSYSLRPHGPQHARPPYPSPTPGVYPNSCPLSRWYHLTISSSVVPFSSCLQSFPASGSFPVVSSLHQVAKGLELQIQQQSFQWIFRVDFL